MNDEQETIAEHTARLNKALEDTLESKLERLMEVAFYKPIIYPALDTMIWGINRLTTFLLKYQKRKP